MNTLHGLRSPDGQYNWDFIEATDLRMPDAEAFYTFHVYKDRQAVLSQASVAQLRELANVSLEEGDIESAQAVLRAQGYAVDSLFDKTGFHAAMVVYSNEIASREGAFRNALFDQEKVRDNPRADLCFEKAVQAGRFDGRPNYRVVTERFIDLVELIR